MKYFYKTLYLSFMLLWWACGMDPGSGSTSNPEKEEGNKPEVTFGLMHQLQGRWKDAEIKDAEVLISGNKFISIYQEEVRQTATFAAFAERPKHCPGKDNPKAVGYLVVYREGGPECLVVKVLQNGVFEYEPLGQ